MRRSSRAVIVFAFAAISLVAAGCTDPSAVGRFASAGKAAEESFAAIAGDFPEACARRERYRLLAEEPADLETLEEDCERSCARHAKAAPRLAGANRVLVRYLDALGKLAAGDLVTFDKSLEGVADALADGDLVDDAGIHAVSGICGVVAGAAAGKWRRAQLGAVIDSTNASVQILTAALRDVISIDYSQLLDDESEAARKFYFGRIKEHGGGEPLAALLVYERWREADAEIEGRRAAASAYAKALRKIAAGHQTLYERRKELGSKETRALLLDHIDAIEDLLADARTVF